jgi:hypothetical protein
MSITEHEEPHTPFGHDAVLTLPFGRVCSGPDDNIYPGRHISYLSCEKQATTDQERQTLAPVISASTLNPSIKVPVLKVLKVVSFVHCPVALGVTVSIGKLPSIIFVSMKVPDEAAAF